MKHTISSSMPIRNIVNGVDLFLERVGKRLRSIPLQSVRRLMLLTAKLDEREEISPG